MNRNGTLILLLIFSVLLIANGCRKEIVHEVGKTIIYEADWKLVKDSPENTYCLLSYYNKMLLGGKNTVNTYDENKFEKAFSGDIWGKVNCLLPNSSSVWIVGNFWHDNTYKNETYYNVLSLRNSIVSGMTFGDSSTEIRKCTNYNEDLIVIGDFDTIGGKIKTKNIDWIRQNKPLGFSGGLNNPPQDITSFRNAFYVCGGYDFVGMRLLGTWKSGVWSTIERFSNASTSDKGYSLAVNQDNLYFLCDKISNLTTNVQVFDGFNWSEIEGVSIPKNSKCRLKAIDETL